MFEEKMDILKMVYQLAHEKESLESSSWSAMDDGIDLDAIRKEREEYPLLNYLKTLDYADIQMIQTIMYLGRDKDYTGSEPREIYDSVFKRLDWNPNKNIEINQIYGKLGVLYRYLKNGFEILNIRV